MARKITQAVGVVISSPDQIFCANPAASAKNRVWTPLLEKKNDIQQSVIVGVNCIHYQLSSVSLGTQKSASCDDI